ncbi:MAG: tetratricopeptide repeat protein [Fidelibacterota bacterium]|nr:MAG: tetratricopeptide repeat protein [Candidatus Neomarinimicrobiota bacterium]
MTICITGMHRTGTSMIARLLNLCGLYLGPEERIMPPDEGNPAGYWQNQDMDQLTEDILAHFTGDWDFLLPRMPQGWETKPDMAPFRERAQQLIGTIGERKQWGWKDPRCSLILPFWRCVLPGLKVVVCLRNPIETAKSLGKQVSSTDAFSYNLWLRYYQRIFADTDPGDRLITHYDMYFVDPRSELHRVLHWLGWSVPEERLDAACRSISSSHRQHRLTEAELNEAKAPFEVAEAYAALCAAGGKALQEAMDKGLVLPLKLEKTIGSRLPESDTTTPEAKMKAQASFERANEFIECNQLGEALKAMQETVSLHPFHAQAQNDLAVLYLNRGDKEQALAHLSLARQLNPENTDTAKNLAEVYLELGRTEDALQTFLDIVERHPRDTEALFSLGTACASLGMEEQARKLFSRILEMETGHAEAEEGLAEARSTPSNS